MSQPPGVVHLMSINSTKHCMVLTQALQAWFTKLSNAFLGWGFQFSRPDSSMFIHHFTTKILILFIHVDDIFIIGNNSAYALFISHLHSSLALRNLGNLNYFHRVEVFHVGTSLHLNTYKTSWLTPTCQNPNLLPHLVCWDKPCFNMMVS